MQALFKRGVGLFLENKYLALVIVLAAFLRLGYLTYAPASLNWDEVSHGYNAYSILTTGRDEWGEAFPLIFRAYGDYKLPVYIYITAISEAIFGLGSLAVRLPSALAGMATVIFTYLLVKKLFDQKSALVAALLVAVEPWSLFLSRAAFEANLALAFIVSGVYFFVGGLQKPRGLIFSAALFGLSIWTYNSARVFVPILLLVLVSLYKKDLKAVLIRDRKSIALSLIFAAVFFLGMFWQLANPAGLARYGKVAIINDGTVAQIDEARNDSTLPEPLKRIFYNRASFFAQKFVKNWASYFSGDFLFGGGGSNFQFSVPGRGVIYTINAFFLAIGLIHLVKLRTKASLLLISWFFLGPVAASLTSESRHVLRAITTLPTPMIISALGLISFSKWLRGKLKLASGAAIYLVYFLAVGLLLKGYLSTYWTEYRKEYSWSWQFGYKEAVEYAKKNYEAYDTIIVSKKYGEPHEFFLFFWPWDPQQYRVDPNLNRFYQSGWYWVDGFDKFYFVNDWDIPKEKDSFVLESKKMVDCSRLKCLLITSPDNYPMGWKKLEAINFLDGKAAFEIYENK